MNIIKSGILPSLFTDLIKWTRQKKYIVVSVPTCHACDLGSVLGNGAKNLIGVFCDVYIKLGRKILKERLFCASIRLSSNTVYEMYKDRSIGKMRC